MNDILMHYGTPRHSGRYPWGSGEDPYQHESDFLNYAAQLQKEGLKETEIANAFGMSTTEYRQAKSNAVNAKRADDINKVLRLAEKGYSNTKIATMLGITEGTVRNYKKEDATAKATKTNSTAEKLKEAVAEKGYIDVGKGVEYDLGVSSNRLSNAVKLLADEGYAVHDIKVEQANNKGKFTTIKVLAPPETTWAEVMNNKDKIKSITDYSSDGGLTWTPVQYPSSLSSKRVMIRYGDEGGADKDGVIEIREGVEDISLGNSRYAQVRILVDGTHYMKGMAMYNNNMPDGVDVIFNTNKKSGTEFNDVLKKIKNDPTNPFGATIKANGQRTYVDENGETQLSPINKIKEEGDWNEYSRNLSSQFLSKQNLTLINKQLNLSLADKQAEFEEICGKTNSAIKKALLESFADDCDASAVHLKAAALPRQNTKVILPIPDMADNEVYAPTYENGETVVLIRYPHAGTFEIPQLKVNNRQSTAKSLLGNAPDAIGINSKVAERLSGADFDGDTVLVIPCNSSKSNVKIKTSEPLDGLVGFDPKEKYPYYPGMSVMTSHQKGIQMGIVSNLITDMTLKGAPPEDLVKAVRHSMVVIDAEKHKLNYKQSEIDNDIAALKKKWQGGGGASTLVSRSKSKYMVPQRKLYSYTNNSIDPETGEKIYTETGKSYIKTKTNKDGTVKETIKEYMEESTKMAEAKDARVLSSGHPTEEAYAKYANSLKDLANQARLEWLNTPNTEYNPSAAKIYAEQVDSLNSQLNIALKNAPRERQAQLAANVEYTAKKRANPDMTSDEKKKVQTQAIASARARFGAKKTLITISDKEWEAIQAGAISNNKLTQILNNSDMDVVKELATPRDKKEVSSTQKARIDSLNASGYTLAEIADAMNISSSTVSAVLKGK